MEQLALSWEPQRRLFTVSELTGEIRDLLAAQFDDIWVAGEISGVRPAASGHIYFTLKDERAQLRSVCYRNTARFLKFKPQDGVAVLARGRIDLFEARGEYQLIVDVIEPQGYGALQFAFEQLKKKLAAEGLFDPARKRPIPPLPERIGIVTSPTGAVIQDMLNILTRRFPGRHIRLYPAQVQGEGSVEQVSEGIEYFSESGWAEVTIVARGGGSIEDLWTFNEEAVARAIAASKVPVISAVGHETDFTIADFVADLRAPTPSAAAELVICTRESVVERIEAAEKKLAQALRLRLADLVRRLQEQGIERATALLHRNVGRNLQRIDELDYRMRDRFRATLDLARRQLELWETRLRQRDVRLRFAEVRRRLDAAEAAAGHVIRIRLTGARALLAPLEANLTQLSPLRILERGYAIVQNEAGQVVKSPADAPVDSAIAVRLARGGLGAKVTGHE